MEKLSPLLAKILVVVSFHWNVGKLNYLSTTIDNVLRYPSEVHTCITTNRPERLKRVFAAWELPADSVWVCPEPATPDNDTYRYALLWRHRAVIGAAASGGAQYTAYMYMEDDTLVPWRAMTAWARATPALDERNLTFGFYRTEVSPDTGELVMLDLSIRVNTSTAPTAHIEGVGHFVELPQPYFGMWLASHQQLKAFMAHPFWEKKNALAANAPHGGGYPERTTWMIQYLNVPPGHLTQSVIQYDPVTNTLDPNARVAHLRNGYSANVHQPLGKLPLMLALDR